MFHPFLAQGGDWQENARSAEFRLCWDVVGLAGPHCEGIMVWRSRRSLWLSVDAVWSALVSMEEVCQHGALVRSWSWIPQCFHQPFSESWSAEKEELMQVGSYKCIVMVTVQTYMASFFLSSDFCVAADRMVRPGQLPVFYTNTQGKQTF